MSARLGSDETGATSVPSGRIVVDRAAAGSAGDGIDPTSTRAAADGIDPTSTRATDLGVATVGGALAASGLPRAEALLLLAHVGGRTRERLIAGDRDALPDAVAAAFRTIVARRTAGEPIAYLVGRREFHGRPFAVDARVLIPRPETELVVDLALTAIDESAGDAVRALDLGTGSGAIAITLALERPSLDVVATDASADALDVATANAARLGARVAFAHGDWFDALPGAAPFDVIVSNPPYVAAGDAHLDAGDLRFEPGLALTDGGDGLAHLRRIVAGAPARLRGGGALVVEHGHDQGAIVRALFASAGFVDVATHDDLARIGRATSGRMRRPEPSSPR